MVMDRNRTLGGEHVAWYTKVEIQNLLHNVTNQYYLKVNYLKMKITVSSFKKR